MNMLDIILSLSALIMLEIILGIDNLVFLSILTEKLPKERRRRARRLGLTLAWIMRLLLLGFATYIVRLKTPFLSFFGLSFSLRDIFLCIGGGFLIAKATDEIHNEVSPDEEISVASSRGAVAFRYIVVQIALMDIIFSLDSVLTAVGLTTHFWVMAAAITVAILVMMYASEPMSQFIEKYPSVKMLALSCLLLIGMVLIADGFSFYVPRGYIYFSMGFSLLVESLNLLKRSYRKQSGK